MRLIDADNSLQSEIKRCRCVPLIGSCSKDNENLKEILAGQSTIDPVHAAGVCYCRECVKFSRYTQNNRNFGICQHHNSEVGKNDFCSYGVRREGEGHERID